MTRRFAERQPRRLMRMRPQVSRPEHGVDLALVSWPDQAPGDDSNRRTLSALAEENALLARELGRVQARCTRWRDDAIAQVAQLEAALMRARAEIIVKQTRLAAAHDTLDERVEPRAPSLDARRVLCVGGRARQIPVYLELVERAGGRFLHVDGSTHDCLPSLWRSLAEADLVILHPAFVCQGACRAVELHCARVGVRCIQVDKTCALGFARGLEQALTAR